MLSAVRVVSEVLGEGEQLKGFGCSSVLWEWKCRQLYPGGHCGLQCRGSPTRAVGGFQVSVLSPSLGYQRQLI